MAEADGKRRRYGVWVGSPGGVPENVGRCIEVVYPQEQWATRQCLRRRGHGEDGLYCKQHAKRHPASGADRAETGGTRQGGQE